MEAHDIPESIQWHDGLLLTPQHFQQLSLRHESLLQYVAGSIAPFGWGVRSFEWDASSLAGGTLRVLNLDAVMPDGLVVSFGTRRGEELSLDLKPHEASLKSGASLMVYLAVPARDAESDAVGKDGRYEGDPVADGGEEKNGGSPAIPRLRPRLKLFAGKAPGKSHVSFPLAAVSHNGSAVTLEGFIPPTLAVARASALGRLCSASARHVRDKAEFLVDRLRISTGGARTGFDAETESIIRRLFAPLPQLDAVLSTGVSHPFLVYLAFCDVAGQVATLDGKFEPPSFEPYDHNDLAATFNAVLDYIKRKVEAVAASTFTVHAFKYDEAKGVFWIKFEREWAKRRLVLGMRTQQDMTERDVIRWGTQCVIGTAGPRMDSLRRRRVSGAPRAVIEGDVDLAPPRGVVLFSLDADDPEYVAPGEVLQIFNAGEGGQSKRPSAIVLYVRQAADSSGGPHGYKA